MSAFRHLKQTLLGAFLIASAITGSALAVSMTQEFKTQQDLAQGSIVSLNKEASEVVAASNANIVNLYGVVVRDGDLSFSQGQSGGATIVPVARDGVVEALVSTNAGAIAIGDPITVDNVAGVGQKAVDATKIIGIAQTAFDGKNTDAKQVTLDQNGSKKNITLGTVQVKIEVTDYNPADGNTQAEKDAQNRSKLLKLADGLAGKTVKPVGLIIAGLILAVGVLTSIFLITSSGYASMVSIGRNPLSQKRIVQSLIRMLLIALLIFVVGLLLSYGVIRLL